MDFDQALEDIQIEAEMDWMVLDWWAMANRIASIL